MQQAEASACNQKHGAVVVVGGRVIGRGTNSTRNRPDIVEHPKTQAAVHAEIAALRSCGSTRISGGTLYVARVNNSNKPLMSRPCERCQEAISAAGIKKIVYTIDGVIDL